MTKPLNIELTPQKKIPRESSSPSVSAVSKLVGKRRLNFFIPEIRADLAKQMSQGEDSKEVQVVVDQINRYIENIADDYFLLGLHLIALHRLLKQSKMTIDQIKNWYTENINMPYSSAMQCKKVAEVYQSDPELINKYTASGAYLLSSFATQEEREDIWNEARGDKESPTIRELRMVIRQRKVALPPVVISENNPPKYVMESKQILASFKELAKWAKQLDNTDDEIESYELRQVLIRACRHLIDQMLERLPDEVSA